MRSQVRHQKHGKWLEEVDRSSPTLPTQPMVIDSPEHRKGEQQGKETICNWSARDREAAEQDLKLDYLPGGGG